MLLLEWLMSTLGGVGVVRTKQLAHSSAINLAITDTRGSIMTILKHQVYFTSL
jgi:hypothetical protein